MDENIIKMNNESEEERGPVIILYKIIEKKYIVFQSYMIAYLLECLLVITLAEDYEIKYEETRKRIRFIRKKNLDLRERMKNIDDHMLCDKMSDITDMFERILDNLKTYTNYYGISDRDTIDKASVPQCDREILVTNKGECTGAKIILQSEFKYLNESYSYYYDKFSDSVSGKELQILEKTKECINDKWRSEAKGGNLSAEEKKYI